jgi:hypothetical protein
LFFAGGWGEGQGGVEEESEFRTREGEEKATRDREAYGKPPRKTPTTNCIFCDICFFSLAERGLSDSWTTWNKGKVYNMSGFFSFLLP